MTSKELLYVEDALGHAQYCKQKCDEAVGKITDAELKMCIQQISEKNQQIFQSFYGLL